MLTARTSALQSKLPLAFLLLAYVILKATPVSNFMENGIDPRQFGASCSNEGDVYGPVYDDSPGFIKAAEFATQVGEVVMIPDNCYLPGRMLVDEAPKGTTYLSYQWSYQ